MSGVRRIAVLITALALTIAMVAPAALALPGEAGSHAYGYLQQLAFVSRVAGASSEVRAAGMIEGWFDGFGYTTEFQSFSYTNSGKIGYSQNVVAFLPANTGEPDAPLVIVGAHYDSVIAGNGADDNASGVASMIEIAETVVSYERDYDVVFVAFGAEEAGLKGSYHFAGEMSEIDVDRTAAMINFDSLIAGDKLYIHAGSNEKTGPRDAMLSIIGDLSLPIETQPGLNEHYPAGFTPDYFSDYTAFNQAGIPVVAFESTNWELGDLDGYVQTEKYGSFWHTGKDKLKTIEQRYPGRPMERLAAYTTLVETYLEQPVP